MLGRTVQGATDRGTRHVHDETILEVCLPVTVTLAKATRSQVLPRFMILENMEKIKDCFQPSSYVEVCCIPMNN